MIIAVVNKKFNDNATMYHVYKNEEYTITTNASGLGHYLGLDGSTVARSVNAGFYNEYEFEEAGECRKVYRLEGEIGSIDDHRKRTGLSKNTTIRRIQRKGVYIGVKFDSDNRVRDIWDLRFIQRHEHEKPEPEELPREKTDVAETDQSDKPKKTYLASMIDQLFKKW